MKNISTKIALGATALLLVAVAAQPVLASCSPVAAPMSTRTNVSTYSWIYASGWGPNYGGNTFNGQPYDSFPSLDQATLFGAFWAIGSGNPTTGAGDDNGTWQAAGGWLAAREYPTIPFFYATEIPIGTGWGTNAGIDGCITNNVSRCTCVLLSQNGPGGPQFAVFSSQADAGASTLFTLPGNAPLKLAPVPVPNIDTSVRDATTFDLTMNVTVPSPAAGIYEDIGGFGCPPCGVKYLVKEFVRPRGMVGAPTDEDVTSYTDLTDHAATDLGTQAVGVRSLCGSQNNDVWFATQIVTDDGFNSPFVSAPSTRIECGPTLADPGPKEKPVPVNKPLDRPGRRGRTGR